MDRALQRQEDWYRPLNQPKPCAQTPNNPPGTIGVSAYAAKALGDVVYVSLPAVGDAVVAGDTCGEVESTKSVSDLYAPVSGEVTAVNGALDATPELVNSDPYGEGWMYELRPTDAGAHESLLDVEGYTSQLS